VLESKALFRCSRFDFYDDAIFGEGIGHS
jgi:hypothetical protein